jgi:uncharacterized membrane protein
MSVGPLHILVFGFDRPNFTGAALRELQRLEGHDLVRLVDLLFVEKADDGTLVAIEIEGVDPELAEVLGDLAGALVGVDGAGDELDDVDDDLWDIAAEIPPGTAAAIVLLEHRWAIGLGQAIADAGGELLADALVPPSDLALMGAEFQSAVETRVS